VVHRACRELVGASRAIAVFGRWHALLSHGESEKASAVSGWPRDGRSGTGRPRRGRAVRTASEATAGAGRERVAAGTSAAARTAANSRQDVIRAARTAADVQEHEATAAALPARTAGNRGARARTPRLVCGRGGQVTCVMLRLNRWESSRSSR
jgi:hypothetical protein